MDWNNYRKRYRVTCSMLGISQADQDMLLDYAERLNSRNLPIIFDQRHFSRLVGFSQDLLMRISNDQQKFYRKFSIPKHNGKRRDIREPYPTLKEIQLWILVNILEKVPVSDYAKAYVKGRSVLDNARFHRGQRFVIKLDVKNFFESIKLPHVVYIFLSLGYERSVATLLANLVCLNGHLPQGACTSPAISNIYSSSIDRTLASYTRNRKLRYTRYSDDITISGAIRFVDIGKVVNFVGKVLEKHDLSLQTTKTQLLRRSLRQSVTGIVVNQKLSVSRTVKKSIRQAIYYIRRFGLDSHVSFRNIEKRNYVSHLRGLVNWVLFVERGNREFREYREFLQPNNVAISPVESQSSEDDANPNI